MRRFFACAVAVLAGISLARAQTAVDIVVDVAANRHSIDPRIYGVAHADTATLGDLRVPLHRWGGNVSTRHNWQANASNRGADWYFESIADGAATPGLNADNFVNDSKANGAQPLITIPMLGWVAKVGASRQSLASFSVAKYGAQQSVDPWFTDAGNGVNTSGQNITGNDPNDANVASDPAFQRAWVQHLVSRWGLASAGGVRYYALDNEPGIWHSTHRDVHPNGASMDEVFNASVAYASQIKAVDAGAQVLGPEEWGWSGYLYSGRDLQYGSANGWSNLPDRTSHGNQDYVAWYLSQFRQRDTTAGQRLLDIFSLHYYPQGGEYGNDTSTTMQQRRNRSTRSLWDPSYVDESWIGTQVQLIPRMKAWVNTYYPGTKLGITEYNWGAEGHINGATTQADILGIFGREALDMATFWTFPAASTPTYKAIKMYRNYDGQGSGFGDTSVSALAPNPDSLSVFAAQRSTGAVTIMAINKDLSVSPSVNLRLQNFTSSGAVQVWRLTSTNVINRLADASVSSGTIAATLPAQSITLFVVGGQTGTGTQAPGAPTNVRVLSGPAGTPASVATSSGSPQSAAVNSGFAAPLRALVRDAGGNPVSGVTVTFTAPASGASARFGGSATATAYTDASGVATSPALTANGTTGSYTVSASATGASVSASFSLTNTSTGSSGSSNWTNATPAGVNLNPSGVCATGAGNFGTVGMTVDPSTPGAAVFAADCQGLYRTTDAGVTWTKIYNSNASAGFNGSQWSMAWAPSGSFAVSVNGYGSRGGIWRTTNRGASWTQMVSDDINAVSMSPTNENHLMATSHGGSNNWYESTNGGASWSSIGAVPAGIWYYGEFLSDTVWIGIGPNGLWRGVKSGSTWSWSNPLSIDGPHGGAQFFRDTANGWFYVGAATKNLTRKMYRTSLSSAGSTWTEVADFGFGYGVSTLFGTPGRIYGQANFATNGTYDPSPQTASTASGTSWTAGPTTPSAMTNGAHAAAVVCDGTNYVLLTSNTNAGVWRYVTNEACR